MFSAYDLKKIIPRAVFALVAASLSWSLMNIMVNAVTFLGDSAQALVTAPFPDELLGISLGGSSGGLALGALAVGGLGVGLGLLPIAGVAIAGLLGILFAFAIVLLRRVALVGLVIISPLAIALSVFPQTESWAKKWWDWFSKLLLMYPFIMAFFGLSEVAAGVLSNMNNPIYKLAAIAVLIGPYFIIGKAFSFAGGTIGKLAGMVNNRDKGAIDKVKKWDGNRVANNRADAKAGTRYQDRFGARTINRTLGLAANRGSNARLQDSFTRRMATLKESTPDIESLTGKEARLLALSEGSEAKMKDAVTLMATELQQETPSLSTAEALAQAKALAASAKRKAKSVNASTAAYALQKAVESGSMTDGAEIDRIGASIGAATLGAKQGAAYGADLAAGAKGGAIKKQQETLIGQTQAINAAEQAGNFELADQIREQAGYKFEIDASGERKLTIDSKGTAANLKELGKSYASPENKSDLSKREPATWDEAGGSRKRRGDSTGRPSFSASTPTASPPPSSPPPTPVPAFKVGQLVRSKISGTAGEVTSIAPDGMPVVTYDTNGKPVAATKAENLEIR